MIKFFKIWILLSFTGYLLLYLRKDSKIIIEDIKRFTYKNFPFNIISILLLIFYLPFSIIYSIKNIINGN